MKEMKLTTKKQHYVPQVYLRGFSPEYVPLRKSNIPNEKYSIFSYNLDKKAYDSNEAVPISSICYKKNLYEIYGTDESVIYPNWLENYFGRLEIMFETYRNDLERKALKDNIGVPNFLTTKERIFWVTFVAIHLLRNAYVLDEEEAVLKELIDDSVSDKEIKSIVRFLCLPFFQEINENSVEAKILSTILAPMYKMKFVVGIDLDNKIMTSDKGVSVIAKEFPTDEYDEVIFPITSSICIFLVGNENKDVYQDNTLLKLSEEGKKHITVNVVLDAYKSIYSNHRFSVQEKKFIKEIVANRQFAKEDTARLLEKIL